MYIEIQIPDIDACESGFADYEINLRYRGHPPENDKVRTLVKAFIHLAEVALREYRLGKTDVEKFWSTHDAYNHSAAVGTISHFESCLGNTKVAIKVFKALKEHNSLPDGLRELLKDTEPRFADHSVNKPVFYTRNEIHHIDNRIVKGEIPIDRPFVLLPSGPETPHPTVAGQPVKAIDRLSIGKLDLPFADLAALIKEIVEFAHAISNIECRS